MTRNFDPDSGQVYIETTSSNGPMTSEWLWKTPGNVSDFASWKTPGPGSASLCEMAARCALVNLQSITAESLERVPVHLGMGLWRHIVASKLDSLRNWKVFASVYPGEQAKNLLYRQQVIYTPQGSFQSYITPLISTSFKWITFLTLSGITCSRTDFLQLTRLTNIGVLTIGKSVKCPDGDPDDSMIKSWSRAAAESNSFSKLRIINCCTQKNITQDCIPFLNFFPLLALFTYENYDVNGWDHKISSRAGWYLKTEYHHRCLLRSTTNPAWQSEIDSNFRGGVWKDIPPKSVEEIEALRAIPVVHLSLGISKQDSADDPNQNPRIVILHRIKNAHPGAIDSAQILKRLSSVERRSGASKKPKMRASKQKNVEDMLTGFGS